MSSRDAFSSINIEEEMQLSSEIAQPMEPYHLVELLYNDPQIPRTPNVQPQSQLPLESKRVQSTSDYKCELCHRSFKEASHFTNHKRGGQCQKSTQKRNAQKKSKTTKSSVDKRRKASSPPFKPYECNICGARFCDKGNVQLHLQKIHQSNEELWCEFGKPSGYACSLCDFWFSDKSQLKNHQQEHTNNFSNMSTQNSSQAQTFYCGTVSENNFIYVNPVNNDYSSVPSQQSSMNTVIDNPITLPNNININHVYNSQTQYSGSSYIQNSTIHDHSTVPKNADKKNEQIIDKSVNSKWHPCQECELRFIDPINLELHVKRKHCNVSTSSTNNLTTLESPITFATYENCNITPDCWKADKISKSKSCVCNACGAKVATMSDLSAHMKSEHVSVELENSAPKRKSKTVKVALNVETKCDHCLTSFQSVEAILIHKTTQKFVFCGVCDFSSCSDTQVAIHIYSVHSKHLPSSAANRALAIGNSVESSSPKNGGNRCTSCNVVADTGCILVQHLECHGSLKIQCVKCSEVKSSYELICHHIHSSHMNQIVRIKVSSESSHPITVLLTPDLVTSAAIKCSSPTNDGIATHKSKKVKLSSTEIDNFVCSSCCVSMHREKVSIHLMRHQRNNLGGYDKCPPNESDKPLCRDTTTVEFVCSECGFSRKTPEHAVNHIQTVHLSGKLIHVKKLHNNKVESFVSNVFTPPSLTNYS